jgi:hypothetical protein
VSTPAPSSGWADLYRKEDWSPFLAFTAGVTVNVPLGYALSEWVFGDYWRGM